MDQFIKKSQVNGALLECCIVHLQKSTTSPLTINLCTDKPLYNQYKLCNKHSVITTEKEKKKGVVPKQDKQHQQGTSFIVWKATICGLKNESALGPRSSHILFSTSNLTLSSISSGSVAWRDRYLKQKEEEFPQYIWLSE